MTKTKPHAAPTPEKLLAEALLQDDINFSIEDIRLLVAGLASLREEPALNSREAASVSALIAFASYEKGLNENQVRSALESHYSVPDYNQIRSSDYDDAVHYLLDMGDKSPLN